MKTFKFIINGNKYQVEIKSIENSIAELELNGTPYSIEIERDEKVGVKTPTIIRPVIQQVVQSNNPEPVKPASGTTSIIKGEIKSPLPGVIVDIFVKAGDIVKVGQRVVLLEAMKMDNNIESDKAGTVIEVKVTKGSSVYQDDVLIVIGG